MQTSLPEDYLATAAGRRAEEILRACVHCGFCNATCPTYQLLGDERDGPRGRIYLIKDMLERQTVSGVTVTHLDRCLTCRACETTCPSGVAYGELLEIGRGFHEAHHPRGWLEALKRRWLARVVPNPEAFRRWAGLGRLAGPFLGRRFRRQLPPRASRSREAPGTHGTAVGRVLLLDGCVQRVSTPAVNQALAKILAGRGIEVVRVAEEGCCGGLALHLGREAEARETMVASLQTLAGVLDDVDAVISSASGCGVTLKDYGRLLAGEESVRELARTFAGKVRDVGEYLESLGGEWTRTREDVRRVALHLPCTLQHGQRAGGAPERLLARAGYELVPVPDAHLCCGSAGTYSLLQPELSERLGAAKVKALGSGEPDLIASANVGCQVHLASLAEAEVIHWVELLDTPGAPAG